LLFKKSLILLLFILFITFNLFPCTIFCAHSDGEVWAGNSEDWPDQDTWIWFMPGDKTNYGMVLTGYNDANGQGGMNEKGLFFDWFLGNGTGNLAPNDSNKLNHKGCLSEKILAECATVSEALELYDKYNNPSIGPSIILLADSSGDSATVRWNWQKNKIEIERTTENYQVIGVRQTVVNNILSRNNTDISLDRFTSLVKIARQRRFTVYSSIYDLVNKNVFLYYNENFTNMKQWNLIEELNKPAHFYNMRALFPEEKKDTKASLIILQSEYFIFLLIFIIAFIIYIFGIVFWISRLFWRKTKFKNKRYSHFETGIIYSSYNLIMINGLLYLFAGILLFNYPAFILSL